MPRRAPNTAANAAKTRDEAQARACGMERAVRNQITEMHYSLGTRVSHERFLSTKYLADRYLDDLTRWLRTDSQKRACGAAFVRDIRVRMGTLRTEIWELQAVSQNRPSERRRRRRERRQYQAEQDLLEEQYQAREALERAQARVAELEARVPRPVESSSSLEPMDAEPARPDNRP